MFQQTAVGYWVKSPNFWVGNYRPTKQTDLDWTTLHHCGYHAGAMSYSGGEIIGMVCPNLLVGRYAYMENGYRSRALLVGEFAVYGFPFSLVTNPD